MKLPEIIKKNMEDILKDMRGKIPFYTPEWGFEDDGDFGVALSEIFAYYSEIFVKRLNQAPARHFLAFLDTINASLMPPQSARAPLTFVLSEGATENVLIPSATEASASDNDGKPIPFQTESNFMATPSKPVSIFSVIPDRDSLFEHSRAVNGAGSTCLFEEANIQEHTLYIGDNNLLNLRNKAKIKLHIEPSDESVLMRLKDSAHIRWAYGTEAITKKNGQEIKEVDWLSLGAIIETSGGKLVLTKNEDRPIDEIELRGLKSRWIRGTLRGEDAITTLKGIKIGSLTVSIAPEGSRTLVINPIPVRNVQGIGDIFQERLAKVGIETVDQLLNLTPDESIKALNCRTKRAEAILEAARKAFYDRTNIQGGGASDIVLAGLSPDLVYYNDVPCPVIGAEQLDIHPFGKKPQLHDTFYIGSEEAFSKTDYRVDLNFAVVPGRPSDPSASAPQLSWEYWDGEGWNRLDLLSQENWTTDKACNDTRKLDDELRKVTVVSMPEVKKTKVNGKETYWIRVRLVGGDYGKEYGIVNNEVQPGNYCPPIIKGLKIDYSRSTGDAPEHIFTVNNRILDKVTGNFIPFKPLEDVFPSVYVAFDKPLKGGPFSLFISVDESIEYPSESYPRTRWQILEEEGNWIDLDVLDETRGFTRTGVIQFVISSDMKAAKRFGSDNDLFWIRAVIVENFPEAYKSAPVPSTGLFIINNQGRDSFIRGPRRRTIDLSNISLKVGSSQGTLPTMVGCFANTTWAFQARTVKDEALGSSTGEGDQKFLLMSAPIVKSEVWVNEAPSLVEAEMKLLSQDPSAFEERKDEQGNLIEFWVRWTEKDDFVDSAPGDRHYKIDKSTGDILFGDGSHGAIPPIGTNNIKATYATGGGKRGNVSAHAVSKLQSAIPFVDRVYNPIAADGGADREETDGLLKRAPALLKHRHRATALEDYEWLAKEASREVARVKVLSNVNATGVFETGWVTVVIVPEDSGIRPTPSPELRRLVEAYLREIVPNVASIRVIPPSYVKIRVTADIFTKMIHEVPIIEHGARKRVEAFLHPLTGGPEGEGWPFGVIPCVSDIYAILGGVEDVDYVNNVFLTLEGEDGMVITVTETLDGVELPLYALPYSGDHTISARWEEKKED